MSATDDAGDSLLKESEEHPTQVEGRSLTQIAWGRLRRDKVAMISLAVIILIFMGALFAPLITRLLGIDPYEPNTDLVSQSGGLPLGRLGGISLAHPLGVEPLIGRDILARLLYGARISLTIAGAATTLVIIFGVLLGTVAGYSKGKVDTVISRIMDLTLSFPFLLVVIAMAQPLQQRLETWIPSANAARVVALVLLLSLFSWPYLARLIRGQVLSLREREFVEAAVSTGASSRRILFKELIPNLWAPILVYASLAFPGFITAEATLAYLGVGVLPPTPTWGAMLSDSVRTFTVVPSYFFIPGTALFITVLVFNLFGDSVRDALDPRAGRG
ncbi:MAG TPA: ABC transporter permease [Motilibacterales bacterium]|nr:ABC transporter permease [Motilibacterales bacterium]